jgi:hypothetical protein
MPTAVLTVSQVRILQECVSPRTGVITVAPFSGYTHTEAGRAALAAHLTQKGS